MIFQERIFQCWFNTFFVQEDGVRRMNTTDGQKLKYLTLEMTKTELDKANKDKDNKIYKPDFKVSIPHRLKDALRLTNDNIV